MSQELAFPSGRASPPKTSQKTTPKMSPRMTPKSTQSLLPPTPSPPGSEMSVKKSSSTTTKTMKMTPKIIKSRKSINLDVKINIIKKERGERTSVIVNLFNTSNSIVVTIWKNRGELKKQFTSVLALSSTVRETSLALGSLGWREWNN